jgi:hypothetical protein
MIIEVLMHRNEKEKYISCKMNVDDDDDFCESFFLQMMKIRLKIFFLIMLRMICLLPFDVVIKMEILFLKADLFYE